MQTPAHIPAVHGPSPALFTKDANPFNRRNTAKLVHANDIHVPVMLKTVLHWLISNRNGVYFDGTLGDGGHTRAIAGELTSAGQVISVDWDNEAIEHARTWHPGFEDRVTLFRSSFREMPSILLRSGVPKVSGILLDLGLSSRQLDDRNRGFSHRFDGALDMRMDDRIETQAYQLLNECSVEELTEIFRNYGEEKRSASLARKIIKARETGPVNSTNRLIEIMQNYWKPAHFVKSASRIFQALRIAVNRELEVLEHFLENCWNWLAPGGRIVIISYHSLEDRLVKNTFRQHENPCSCPKEFPVCICGLVPDAKVLTKRAVKPTEDEIALNSRARSAVLRAAEKI